MGDAVGAQSRPAGSCRPSRGAPADVVVRNVSHSAGWHAEQLQRFEDRLERAESLTACSLGQLRGQPAQPRLGRTTAIGDTAQRTTGKTPLRAPAAASARTPDRERPRKSGSAARGPAGRCRRPSLPAAGRDAGWAAACVPATSLEPVSTLAADAPQRLQREGFPSGIAPALDRLIGRSGRAGRPGLADMCACCVPGLFVQARWLAVAQVAHDPAPRFLDEPRARTSGGRVARNRVRASVSATNQRSSAAGAVRSGYCSIASRSCSRVPRSPAGRRPARPGLRAATADQVLRRIRPRASSSR